MMLIAVRTGCVAPARRCVSYTYRCLVRLAAHLVQHNRCRVRVGVPHPVEVSAQGYDTWRRAFPVQGRDDLDFILVVPRACRPRWSLPSH